MNGDIKISTKKMVLAFCFFLLISSQQVFCIEETTPESWSIDISAPNSIQDVTVGIDPSATESLDSVDSWSLPPYPVDKVFLLIDGYFSKNIKQGDNGASWDFKVRVPDGETTTLTWDSNSVSGVNIRIFDGNTEIFSGDEISSGFHDMEIYATYGDDLDLHPAISIDRPASVTRSFTLSGTVADDNLKSLSYSVNGESKYLPYVQDGSIYTFNKSLNLVDGDYVVEVEATDSASTSKSVSFTIDNTIPDLNVTILPYNENVKVSIAATDVNKLSIMECTISNPEYVDGSKYFIRNSKSFDESFKFRDLDVGSYTVDVSMEDCVGNIATFSEDFEIIDLYPPQITQITIILPEDSAADSTFFRINVKTNEKATLVYRLNSHNETDVVELEQHAVDGRNTLVVYATDLSGNTASKEITFDYVNGIVRQDTIQHDACFIDYGIVDCEIVIEEDVDNPVYVDEVIIENKQSSYLSLFSSSLILIIACFILKKR
ncbi:MAG: hypothetical protein R2741_02200 [Methanolobus sp.]